MAGFHDSGFLIALYFCDNMSSDENLGIFLFLIFLINILILFPKKSFRKTDPFGRASAAGATVPHYRATCIGATRGVMLASMVDRSWRDVAWAPACRASDSDVTGLSRQAGWRDRPI
jgi:hypothetical protein